MEWICPFARCYAYHGRNRGRHHMENHSPATTRRCNAKPPDMRRRGFRFFEHSVLAPTYSRLSTTIGAGGLNFRVRKENGCDPTAEAPARSAQACLRRYELRFVDPPTGGK